MSGQFIIALLYAVTCMAAVIYTEKNNSTLKKPSVILMVVLVAAGALRRRNAIMPEAYWFDISCFKRWGDAIAEYGMKNVYSSGIFLDYPPGYMYVLWLLNLVQDCFALGIDDMRYNFIMKIPSMLADLACVVIIYCIAKKKLNEKTALFLAVAYAFCPAVIYNSSVWGQIDSWYTIFVVLALYFVTEDRVVPAAAIYAVALITKPQALLFGPVFLFWVISKKDWKIFFKAVGTGIACMWLMALPFSPTLNPLWLIKLYANTFGGYKYFTLNGYNLYMLLGLNEVKIASGTAESYINYLVIGLCFVICGILYFRKKSAERNFSAAVIFITVFFAFCTMMHERYVYPAIILAIFAYIYSGRKGWLLVTVMAATVNYLNVSSIFRNILFGAITTKTQYIFISRMAVAMAVTAVSLMCTATTYKKQNNK